MGDVGARTDRQSFPEVFGPLPPGPCCGGRGVNLAYPTIFAPAGRALVCTAGKTADIYFPLTMANNDWIQLQHDIKPYLTHLERAAATVRDQDVSNYPIFFAYNGEANPNAPGLATMEIPTPRGVLWKVNMTTLEELVARQVVAQERIDPFRKIYKNSPDNLCFLIVAEDGARFGFVPVS